MGSRPPTSLAKSCRGHITTSVPLMVNITAQIYSWNLFFTSGCIYSHRRPGYMPFVLLHLIDCQIGPQSPLFPFSIKQLSSFIWLLLPWWSTNPATDAVRSALQWSAYSPLVQLSLASLWSTGINTNYCCMTDSIFRSPLNHGTLVGCWTKWWNV